MSRTPARFLATLLLSLTCFAPAFAGVNSWTTAGPPGGFFRDVEQSTTDSNVYYAAYSRSVFRSTDGAVTWQAVWHSESEVVDIAVDPTDGNRFYVAALEDGVWRSEDGGQTMQQIFGAPPDMVWSVGVGGADGKTVYWGANTGAFQMSTDRGTTSIVRPNVGGTITQILVDRQDGNSVLAIRDTKIRRSSDGGQSWSENVGYAGLNEFVRVSANEIVIAAASGIYTSPDNGATLIKQYDGSFTSVSVDPASPGTVLAASSDGAIHRRVSAAGTWNQIGSAQVLPFGPADKIIAGGGGTPSRLVIANPQGIQRSTNDAVTWTEATSGPVASNPTDKLASTPGANARVYAYIAGLADGLFSTSLDSGWQRQNVRAAALSVGQTGFGQSAIAVKPGSPQTIYVGTWGRGVFRSNDGGNTWGAASTGLDYLAPHAIAFDPVDPNIMYAAVVSTSGTTPPASLYRSTDGGVTWNQRSTNFRDIFALRLIVDPANRDRLFAAGYQGFFPPGRGGLYRSTDGGITWTQSFAGLNVRDVAIDPADSNRVYAATQLGLQVSNDGGVTFNPNNAFVSIAGSDAAAIAIDPVTPTTLYAANLDPDAGATNHTDNSSYILRSVDRGQSWVPLRAINDAPKWFVGDLHLDPQQPSLIYVTTGVRGVGAFEIQNDLTLSLTGHSGTRTVGAASSFDLHAVNNGAYAGTGVRLRVQLPSTLTGVAATSTAGTCAVASGTVTCTVPVLVPSAAFDMHVTYTPPAATLLAVSADLSAGERDNAPTNNTAAASATAGEVMDLGVTIAPSSTTPQTGTTLTYSITVSNKGPVASSGGTLTFGPASGITLASTLPAGCTASGSQATCTLGMIAPNGTQAFSFTATANTAGTNVANASVAGVSGAAEMNAADNSASSTVTVSAPPTQNPPASSGGGGGGGGGAIDYLMALFLLLMVSARIGWLQQARRRKM